MRSPRVCVFDVDDTLYLERDYILSGFGAVDDYMESTYGVSGFGQACWRQFLSGVRGSTFDKALIGLQMDLNPTVVQELIRRYREHTPAISLSSEVDLVLAKLSSDHQLAIITGGPKSSQVQKVGALDLDVKVSKIVYAGERGADQDKPHPWSWQEIQDYFSVPAEQLVYVGDNPHKDFRAPLDLGWTAIRVRLPGSIHETVETPHLVTEIGNIQKLLQII